MTRFKLKPKPSPPPRHLSLVTEQTRPSDTTRSDATTANNCLHQLLLMRRCARALHERRTPTQAAPRPSRERTHVIYPFRPGIFRQLLRTARERRASGTQAALRRRVSGTSTALKQHVRGADPYDDESVGITKKHVAGTAATTSAQSLLPQEQLRLRRAREWWLSGGPTLVRSRLPVGYGANGLLLPFANAEWARRLARASRRGASLATPPRWWQTNQGCIGVTPPRRSTADTNWLRRPRAETRSIMQFLVGAEPARCSPMRNGSPVWFLLTSTDSTMRSPPSPSGQRGRVSLCGRRLAAPHARITTEPHDHDHDHHHHAPSCATAICCHGGARSPF